VASDPHDRSAPGRAEPPAVAAFEAVYARLRAPLYSFLVRLSGRAELAEDLLQETWIRFARHGHRLEPEADPRPWLFTVARNLYRSHRRWALLDGERLRELGLWSAAEVAGPFEALCASESERRLERALHELSLGEREVLLLCGPSGFQPAEAATILGIGAEAFRQRLARARGKLRERLAAGERPAIGTRRT
jgi:RNA polymerase sigma-70 factor, ECF subfamily